MFDASQLGRRYFPDHRVPIIVGLLAALAWYYNIMNWLFRLLGHQPGLITYVPPPTRSSEHRASALHRFFSSANIDNPLPAFVIQRTVYVHVPFYSCNNHILTHNRPTGDAVAVPVNNLAPNAIPFLDARAPGTLPTNNAARYISLLPRRPGTVPTAEPCASGSAGNGVAPAVNNAMPATGHHSNLRPVCTELAALQSSPILRLLSTGIGLLLRRPLALPITLLHSLLVRRPLRSLPRPLALV